MPTKPVDAGSIQKGDSIVIEGVACRVTGVQVSRPGKHGHAKCRFEAVGIIDEKKRIIVMPGHDTIDTPIIEKKVAQVLSVTGDMANVMDNLSFETFDLKIPDELKERVMDGVEIMYWDILGERVMKEVRGGK